MHKTIVDPSLGTNLDMFNGTDVEHGVPHSRAVAVHAPEYTHVFIAGTAPIDGDGSLVAPGNVREQALHVLEQMEEILDRLDGDLRDIVRLGVYVTDVDEEDYLDLAAIREAVLEKNHYPVSTLLEVEDLALDGMHVEMDAEAFVPHGEWDVETLDW